MRYSQKIDKILEDVGEIKIAVAKIEQSGSDHLRRTDFIEQRFDKTETKVKWAEGALKFVLILGGLFSAILGAFKIFGKAS